MTTSEPNPPSTSEADEEPGEPPAPAPIPAGGTPAPPDDSRVFGRTDEANPHPQPGGGATSSSRQPSRTPMGEQDQRRLLIQGRVALILGLGGLVIATLFFPAGFPLGLALCVVGFGFGVVAMRRGRRAGTKVPGALTGVLIGSFALLLAAAAAATLTVFWDEISDYSRCAAAANTQTAENRCYDAFVERMETRWPGQFEMLRR